MKMKLMLARCSRIFLLLIMALSCSKNEKSKITQVKNLPDYPSASAVDFLDDLLFIIGDDAKNILVLDTNLNIKDSISLYSYPEKRIPKNIKPDLEAMAAYRDNNGSSIFLFGSGSLSPYRNIGWQYNLETKVKDSISLDSLYAQINHSGVAEINIEGACFIPGFLILANRGNKTYRKNHLIFIKQKFWKKENVDDMNIALIGQQTDTSSFTGVSGLSYSAKTDRLILTVSTEDTKNSFEDGSIGKSYLWIVKNISSKKNWRAINPDMIIDLESIDKRFVGQKIESACVTAETKDFIQLVLVADNDKGSSTVIKMNLKKD